MARRVVLFVLGGVLLVIGALAAIAGGALMALFGSNDTLSSGVQQVSTPTRALVSPAGLIQGVSGAQTVVGSVRLRITATPTGAGHLLFLGIGPASAVDRYLSGVSHDVATDVSVTPFHLTLARQGGTATPPPPGSQSFWVAKASGNHPALTWTVTSGSYRVVVMNIDAAAPVAFAGGLDLTIPHSFAIGIGLLIGGIVLIVIAIVLIVLGARARPRPQSRPVPDPAAGTLARPGRTGRYRAQELDIGGGTYETRLSALELRCRESIRSSDRSGWDGAGAGGGRGRRRARRVRRRIAIHDTRRTCGSLLAALDVHPRAAMAILRHSRIALTMEIYTQVPDKTTRDTLKRLSDWLGQADDEPGPRGAEDGQEDDTSGRRGPRDGTPREGS